MNRVISWWAKNPVAANLLMVGIALSGLLGYQQMEREILPTIHQNTVEVSILWPGAAPQDVEEQIVVRVEEALKDLDNIERISSSAAENMATIVVQASPKVAMATFVNKIKLRVDAINNFPRDIESPLVQEVVYRNELLRLAIHGLVNERVLKRMADEVRDEVATLKGISIVEVAGARKEEVTIELSETAMRRYNVDFDRVATAIRGSSVNLSAGRLTTQTGDIQLRARNLAENQKDFEDIIVMQSKRGGIIRVGDVARVIDGFEDKPVISEMNGEPAILVKVMSSDTTDVVKVSDSVTAWLEEKRSSLPEGISITRWSDSAEMYKDRMATIGGSAVYGLLLVFAVLLVSLRPKVALWVTVGIATAYAGSFALMPANDVSINILSTFAFLLVLGIVVDDAIVVGESIHEQSMRDGGGSVKSAIVGTQLVAKPVMYAVLTTIIAFVPWFFVTGEDAQVTRQISIVIVLALVFSLVEAFLILPAHLSKLDKRKNDTALFGFQRKIESSFINFARKPYRRFLDRVLANPILTLSIFFSIFIVSVGLLSSGWVRFSLAPQIGNDQITVSVELADGTPHDRSSAVLQHIRLAQQHMVDDLREDGDSTQFVENTYARFEDNRLEVSVSLVSPDVRTISASAASDRWREIIGEIPDAEEISVRFQSNQSSGLSYAISHTDFDVLGLAVDDLKQQLNTYKDVYDVRDDIKTASEELRFSLMPGATQLGLTLADISTQVRQAYYGEETQRLPRDGEDVRVMVRYPQGERKSLDSLQGFRVRTPAGKEVPLFAVAKYELHPGIQKINRRDQRRSAMVTAELLNDDRHGIDRDLQENFIAEWQRRYPGVVIGEAGVSEGEKQFFIEIVSLYVVALFLMYALIAVAFRSYRQPLIIMVAIPFGFMGAVYGHLIFNMPMTLFSYFGVGAAMGVVVNDNLVLIDYINRRLRQGDSAKQAIIEAAVKRFRPIILTSVTTFVGLIPMMAERSAQAEFLQPTVISLAFGVLIAALVTLVLVPAMFLIGIRWVSEPLPPEQPKTIDHINAEAFHV